MPADLAPSVSWARVSERIAATMGLHYPPERWKDLQRGLGEAAEELGFAAAAACGEWLASATPTKAQLDVLASHLTVGETYFFREKNTFAALTEGVLPELIRKRRECGQRLRIWSAACCTGEEAYSLAILLSQVIPDLADWHVTILATDINERFLKKAAAGVYGEWSFRNAPTGFKERYFQRTPEGRYAILPEIRRRVTFAHLNLVEDVFPSLTTDTNAMDLILCRNVLMYFTLPQARKVIGNLRRSLVEDGWLTVSPSEASQVLFADFAEGNFSGCQLYRKTDTKGQREPIWKASPIKPGAFIAPLPGATPSPTFSTIPPLPPAKEAVTAAAPPPPLVVATQLYREGNFAEASETLLASPALLAGAEAYSLLARALANQGRLNDALEWCDRWLGADKLDASGHYLRAVILQELGQHEVARGALQRSVYLCPDLIPAHFALGNVARAMGRGEEADRHFTNTLQLLRSRPPDEALPESDGLTAGRLTEIIQSFLAIPTQP